jgi:glycosyltransferase involved in cell wall biosynthesis
MRWRLRPYRGICTSSVPCPSDVQNEHMKVLVLHNMHELRGGEDEAVRADVALLRAKGHDVALYCRSYEEIPRGDLLARMGIGFEIFWSPTSSNKIREVLRHFRPDIAHFHSIFPLITPSAYYACRAEGVPTVQTLHNYRLICPAATLLRDGKICELCVGRLPWPAVVYGCYRGSKAQSLVMATAQGAQMALGTWHTQVDAFIALTEFARRLFVRGGLPAERIHVRPNVVDRPAPVRYGRPRSAIFVGRLSTEKGVDVLLQAWSRIPNIPLTIVGGGPLLESTRRIIASAALRNVELTGEVSHTEAVERIRRAGMLLLPSIWYEGLPFVLIEALAAGVPVIASNIGGQAEVINDGLNGLLFPSGEVAALVAAVNRLTAAPDLADRLSRGARQVFEERYSPEHSYARLMEIYCQVGAGAAGGRRSVPRER